MRDINYITMTEHIMPSRAPKDTYPGEFLVGQKDIRYKATGEFRAPKKGEYYLSGAIIQAYRANADFNDNMQFWIAAPGRVTTKTITTWEAL
jgi:hypothetical protein